MQRAVSTLSALVARTIARHDLVRRGDRVLVAVSGGADSVGLSALLARLRPKLGIELVAAHVNHRLRDVEADADEQCASENAARLGIPFVRCDLPPSLRTASNLEAKARALRYAALHRLAAETNCGKIATGHTRDDQAETLLLRLIRGSGTAGLASIQPRRRDGVVRPLIECGRAEVVEMVETLGLRYRTDASNFDPRLRRTRVRFDVLPLLRQLNPNVATSLARAADLFNAERAIIAKWIEAQLERTVEGERLDLTRLRAIPPALHTAIIRRWLDDRVDGAVRFTSRHVDAVARLGRGARASGSLALPGGLQVERSYGLLSATRAAAARASFAGKPLPPGASLVLPGWRITMGPVTAVDAPIHLPTDLAHAICAADAPSLTFRVRPPRPGDRVRPLGLGGTRKLSDVFIDRKVPGRERRTYPVVECAGQILWVPGVVRSEVLMVDQTTRATLSLAATRLETP